MEASTQLAQMTANHIGQDFLAEHSLGELAEKLKVTDRQMRRVFRAEFGVSPVEFWQTQRLLALEERRDSYTVYVRPELVAEIAFDGVQRSPRYPGGLALRFARVLRYREDKTAAEADTIQTVRALNPE